MSGLSIYGRQQMMLAFWVPDVFTSPAHLYLALCAVPPFAGDDGSTIVEPGAGIGYARKPYGVGSSWWSSTTDGMVVNAQTVVFGPPTGDWGVLQGWALCTESSGGEIVALGEMSTPYRVIAGPDGSVTVAAGSLTLVQI